MNRALRKILATLEISTDYYECEKIFSRFSAVVKKIIARETDTAELLKKYIPLETYINHTELFPLVFNRMKKFARIKILCHTFILKLKISPSIFPYALKKP